MDKEIIKLEIYKERAEHIKSKAIHPLDRKIAGYLIKRLIRSINKIKNNG